MENSNCFICSKHKGEINIPGGVIYQDNMVYVGHIGINDDNNNYLGHIMIDLKRHVKGIDEMTDEEASRVGIMIKDIGRGLKATLDVDHVYVQVHGDNVPHLHIHIIPRYKNAPKEFWGTHVKSWDEAPRGGEKEVEIVCTKLRNYLHNIFDTEGIVYE